MHRAGLAPRRQRRRYRLVERGFGRVGVREIAEAADVSVGTL
ncbi:TetR family transcriptional regulator [Streptomyces sp. NPDC002143]